MSLEQTSALYAAVKTWIAKQEAFEQSTKEPASLNKAQRKALELLGAEISVTSPPELDGVDYVSLLTRYRQANNPKGEDIVWTEEDASMKLTGGTVGRICRVVISESRGHPEAPVESFPAVGYGIEKGDDPPAFFKKKEAKQYAAKCAIEWLIAQSYMPSNLRDVTFKGDQPIRFVPSTSNESPDEDSDSNDTTPSPKPTTKRTTGPVDFRDESLPANQRLSALCGRLSIQAPVYKMSRSIANTDRYWDGYPDFGNAQHDIPPGLGHVKKVVGEAEARSQVAEKVLKHLLSVYQKRENQAEGLLMPPEGAAL